MIRTALLYPISLFSGDFVNDVQRGGSQKSSLVFDETIQLTPPGLGNRFAIIYRRYR